MQFHTRKYRLRLILHCCLFSELSFAFISLFGVEFLEYLYFLLNEGVAPLEQVYAAFVLRQVIRKYRLHIILCSIEYPIGEQQELRE